jgi:hypothetical protein
VRFLPGPEIAAACELEIACSRCAEGAENRFDPQTDILRSSRYIKTVGEFGRSFDATSRWAPSKNLADLRRRTLSFQTPTSGTHGNLTVALL